MPPAAAAAQDARCLPLMLPHCTGGEHRAVAAPLSLCHSQKQGEVAAAAAAAVHWHGYLGSCSH